jgi:hypothetical protein
LGKVSFEKSRFEGAEGGSGGGGGMKSGAAGADGVGGTTRRWRSNVPVCKEKVRNI